VILIAMVERYVFLKLKDESANEAGRKEVIDRAFQDLGSINGVRRLIIGSPADEKSEASWDVSIVLVFDSADVIPGYLEHPKHRAFVDEFVKPRLEVIKAWNFDVRVEDYPA